MDKFRIVAVGGFGLLSACASTGPHDAALTGLQPNTAHLVILRPGLMYAAERALVVVNGVPTCKLMPHGDCEVNVPAGQTAVSTSLSADFGTSTLVWNTLPGSTYYVELRHGGMGAMMAGAVIGSALGPLGAAAGAGVGQVVDNGTGGPLVIELAASKPTE